MAGSTPYFSLGYFDFGDKINAPINIQREIDRFILIDKQIYGLYSIFGDGVISGWVVSEQSFDKSVGISLSVSSGVGIIQSKASETRFAQIVSGLPSNSTLYIYARHTSPNFAARDDVAFVYSDRSSINGFVKLAKIITGDNTITSISNTDRDFLIVDQTIQSSIANHKHRGSPTKIDLATETKNQLPGARIEALDASQITSGRFDASNIPILSHDDLEGSGVLTPAQVETFINNFSQTNQNLFGEVTSSNLLEQTIFLKYKYPVVDQFYINELAYIAGISPLSDADDVHTTATIDESEHMIVGFPFANGVSYFFTKNFTLSGSIRKCILIKNDLNFSDGVIKYGINVNNSTNFGDYIVIEPNKLTEVTGQGTDFRIGIEIISPSDLDLHDPYLATFHDFVDFEFTNEDSNTLNFHFRIKFYTDEALTNLYKTAYSLSDQEGWIINDIEAMPADGITILSLQSATITYYPILSDFTPGQVYFLSVAVWNGTEFGPESTGYTFAVSNTGDEDIYNGIPRVNNFAILFEMDNNEFVLLN